MTASAASAAEGATADGGWPLDANLADLLVYRHVREGRGDRTAILYRGGSFSYGDIADITARAASTFRTLGVEAGDRIVLLVPDSPAFVAAFFGSLAIQAIAVPVNPALPEEEALFIASHVGAKVAVVYEEFREKFASLRHLPALHTVLPAGDCDRDRSSFEEAIASAGAQPQAIESKPASLAYCLFSSGTTGLPKGIVHRHTDILHCADAYAVPVLGMAEHDVILAVPKLTFGYGLGGNLLFAFLIGATATLVPEPWTAGGLAAAARDSGATLLLAQPRMISEILLDDSRSAAFSSLRLAVSAGEALTPALYERWKIAVGVELLDGFGSTEIGHIFISNFPNDVRPGCAGLVLPGYKVKIVDEAGRRLPPGATGELLVKGASAAPFYWDDPVRSAAAFRNGWVASGDLFRQDGDGYLFYCGRADEMIKAGCGEWVSPTAVESVLSRHPAVLECAVVGSSDADGIVRPKAYVVLGPREQPRRKLVDELEGLVVESWPELPYMHLDSVAFVPTLPRTANGKIQRFKLNANTLTEFSYEC